MTSQTETSNNETTSSSTEPTPPRRRRGLTIVAIALALVLALVAAGPLGQGRRPPSAAADKDGRTAGIPSDADATEATEAQASGSGHTGEPGRPSFSDEVRPPSGGGGSGGEATEDALEQKDNSHGYPDGGADVEEPDGPAGGHDGGNGPLEPLPGTGCQGLQAGASLLVTPDPAVLAPGTMTSALSVTNCGKGNIDWTAATVPSVALASKNGTLAAGSTAPLGFTIDSNAYEPGAVSFKIKVSEPGHNHYADVQAFRPSFGTDIAAGNGQLSAGQEAGGCANHCIVKALLAPNLTSPNLKLEVKTHTPATIKVWWAEQPPDVALLPKGSSPANSTGWTTSLAPLKAATKYRLVVKATDANGKTSTASTSFTTITPYENPGSLANPGGPAGCALQCITKAVLSGGETFSSKRLDVASNTPARFVAQASTKAPSYSNGVPTLAEVASTSSTGEYRTSWTTTLNNLEGDTKYHIVLRAIDQKGHSGYQVGSFTTPPEPGSDVLFTFLKIKVTHDGDSSWKNRGELSFAWGVGDTTVGRLGEDKMSDPATVSVPRGRSLYLAKDVKGFLPTIYVSASERDADGLVEFCSMGTGVAHTYGSSGDCDAKWNVASSGIVSVDSVGGLTPCTSFGLDLEVWGGKGCMQLETVSHGDDYPRFTALVAVELVT